MTRLIIPGLLLLGVIMTALAVVYSTDESRALFVELEQLGQVRDEANAEWTRLRIEQAWLADASRIEQIARDQLGMREPDSINYLMQRP